MEQSITSGQAYELKARLQSISTDLARIEELRDQMHELDIEFYSREAQEIVDFLRIAENAIEMVRYAYAGKIAKEG